MIKDKSDLSCVALLEAKVILFFGGKKLNIKDMRVRKIKRYIICFYLYIEYIISYNLSTFINIYKNYKKLNIQIYI
jgi:hypothetical protein